MVKGLVILRQQHMVCRWQVFATNCWCMTALPCSTAAAHAQTRQTYITRQVGRTQRCELNVLADVAQTGSDGGKDIIYSNSCRLQ